MQASGLLSLKIRHARAVPAKPQLTSAPPIITMANSKPKGIVVFSGGSAANNLVDVFKSVREDKKCQLSYVIPISDNGGSSSELIRVFGGPGILLRGICGRITYSMQVLVMFVERTLGSDWPKDAHKFSRSSCAFDTR